MSRDPVRKQMDWGESADVFGMVPIRLFTSETSSYESMILCVNKHAYLIWPLVKLSQTVPVPLLKFTVKAQHTLDALKGKSMRSKSMQNCQLTTLPVFL